jgi:hypothetical protein
MTQQNAPVTGAPGEALPEPVCSLHSCPEMTVDDGSALNRAFATAGIPIGPSGPIEVHAIKSYSVTEPAELDVIGESSACALHVRRLGRRINAPIDWACEVAVDLATWILSDPPPEGSVIDVVVPASPGSTAPRLAAGFIDSRHIWISVHDQQVHPQERATLRAWARNLVDVMRPRWSASSEACPCC